MTCLLLLLFTVGYVPDGMTPEQYKKLRDKEKKQEAQKKFGAFGPQSFQSRSLRSFQEDLEKGKTGHLMPVFNAKAKVQKGEIRPEDVPYMQRGGKWDNSDIKTAKKVEANQWDKKYNASPAPARVDWTGNSQRTGPGSSAARANAAKSSPPPKEPKKLFGLF